MFGEITLYSYSQLVIKKLRTFLKMEMREFIKNI